MPNATKMAEMSSQKLTIPEMTEEFEKLQVGLTQSNKSVATFFDTMLEQVDMLTKDNNHLSECLEETEKMMVGDELTKIRDLTKQVTSMNERISEANGDVWKQATVHKKAHRLEEALSLYRIAIKLGETCQDDGFRMGNLWLCASICYQDMGRLEEALEAASAAVQYDPTYPAIIINRAELHEKLQNCKEAVEDAKVVLKLQPDSADAKDILTRHEDR